jgi:hypothetical protein
MKHAILALLFVYFAASAFAQQVPSAPDLQSAPEIPFDSVPFLKLTPERNLGEVLSVAVWPRASLREGRMPNVYAYTQGGGQTLAPRAFRISA